MNESAIEVIKLCSSFFSTKDILSLRSVNKELYDWSNETETHIYLLNNGGIKPELLIKFWEFALGIDQLNYHYYVMYDKFKSYGINKSVIESEGVYGEISRDVGRTFPLHPLFREERGIGQQMLENVLKAVSEYVNSIGYCQGMNFVVGALLICEVDPELKQYTNMQEGSIEMIQRTISNTQVNIEKRVFRLFVYIINCLQMTRLWSSGIPGLKLYTYILQHYAEQYVPKLCAHFRDIGFDLSIFVTKWFLTLFAYNLPFSILFKVWSFIFLEKWSGIFRLSIALLRFFENSILSLDLVETSKYLQNIKENIIEDKIVMRLLFELMLFLPDITPENIEKLEIDFNFNELNNLKNQENVIHSKHIQNILLSQTQIDHDILVLRNRLESLSATEYSIKTIFHTTMKNYQNEEIELRDLYQRKEIIRKQIEDIVKYDNTYSYDNMNISHTVTESYIRQNDISHMGKKITKINEQISQEEALLYKYKKEFNDSQTNWEELLERKASLKNQLLELIKEKQNLLM